MERHSFHIVSGDSVNKLTNTLQKHFYYVPCDSLATIYKSFIRSHLDYRRVSLTTTYKSFIRHHLDYADVTFVKPDNKTFSNQIESAQYNAALAMTRTIRSTSKEKLYQELGLETMDERM